MEVKELNDVLDGIKAQVAKATGENKELLEAQIKALDIKLAEAIESGVKTASDALKSDMEVMQKHLDTLDVKMKTNKKGESQKSFSDLLIESLEQKSADLKELKELKGKEGISFNIKAAGTMTTANYTGGVVGLTDLEPGLARIQRRNPFIRQIVTSRPVNNLYVAWAEQANADPGVAGNTAEGAKKTQTDFDIVEASKKVEKITAFIKVSKEALDDIPFLNSEIRTELVELISLKLDADILGANGSTPNMKGILEYATAFSVTGTVLAESIIDANNFDVVRAAAWQVVANNFNPNYVLVNPIDAAAMDLTKANDGHYVMPPFTTQDGMSIGGLRVVANNGVTAGSFLVGDFTKSNLGIREDINIQVGYENDDFTKNLVTILAEVRAVHYIKSNHVGAFVKGTFATAKTALEVPAA